MYPNPGRNGLRDGHASWETLPWCPYHRDLRRHQWDHEGSDSRTATEGVQTVMPQTLAEERGGEGMCDRTFLPHWEMTMEHFVQLLPFREPLVCRSLLPTLMFHLALSIHRHSNETCYGFHLKYETSVSRVKKLAFCGHLISWLRSPYGFSCGFNYVLWSD